MLRRGVMVMSLTLVVTSLGVIPAGATASIQERFHGAFAEGGWRTSDSSFGFTLVSREQDGTTHLSIHQFSDATLNEHGDVIGGTEIKGETTVGVSFAIDTVHYAGASAGGVIPVSTCTIVDGNETDCVDAGTASLSATWVGIGPIPRLPSTDLLWDDCLQVDRNSSVEREADMSVSLSLNGQPVAATQDGFAGFGKGLSELIFACPAR